MRYQTLIAILLCSTIASAEQVTRVVDGDTLYLSEKKIRLAGIDAPEYSQLCGSIHGPWKCGVVATAKLTGMTLGQDINCDPEGNDKYHRILATCYIRGIDINQSMVTSGYALAYRKYSLKYVTEEEEAHKFHKGIWQGDFQKPWDFRADKRNRTEK